MELSFNGRTTAFHAVNLGSTPGSSTTRRTKMVVVSAGLFITHKNESVLLVHPTGANWNSFQIPKGIVEENESLVEAALRETKEEIGLTIHEDMIENKIPEVVLYTKKGSEKVYKKVYYFVIKINSESRYEINKNNLQKEEIDWAGFVPYEEAKKKIFWRFKPALKKIFE